MEGTSRELLDRPLKPSILETLLRGSKDLTPKPQETRQPVDGNIKGTPFTSSLPTSHVLGKVRDFLGVMAKANEKLELDSQVNSRSNYDIEVVNESEEHIEMDLILGVADLHSTEAVAAAEASMSGFQQSATSASSSCTSFENDGDDDDGNDDNEKMTAHPLAAKFKKPKSDTDELLTNGKPNKRPKIVMLD